MKNFARKKILITGGASGIGRLLALNLAEREAIVIIIDININEAENTVTTIKQYGGKAYAFYADIANTDSIRKCRMQMHAQGLFIDGLINNAGVVFGGDFEKLSLEKHLLTYKINAEGPLAITHLFFPDLRKSPEAFIVNIASATGFVGLPFGTSFASSKWAVIGLSESLRLEFLERGINNISITTVCPGYISTGMFEGIKSTLFLPCLKPEKIVKKIIQAVEKKAPFVKEPFMVKAIEFLRGILPLKAFSFVSRLMGISLSMANWKGKKYN